MREYGLATWGEEEAHGENSGGCATSKQSVKKEIQGEALGARGVGVRGLKERNHKREV